MKEEHILVDLTNKEIVVIRGALKIAYSDPENAAYDDLINLDDRFCSIQEGQGLWKGV